MEREGQQLASVLHEYIETRSSEVAYIVLMVERELPAVLTGETG